VTAESTNDRPHASQQLAQLERFHHVVVGAEIQPFDAIVDAVTRSP
jgi:hypothetical protein